MRRFNNMEFASLPKLEPSRNVSSKVISKSTEQQWTLSVCYVCKTSAVHSNDFSNRQQLPQAENALLIFDYY